MINRRLFRDERFRSVLLGLVLGCVDDDILVFTARISFSMALILLNPSAVLSLATIMSCNDVLNMLAIRKY